MKGKGGFFSGKSIWGFFLNAASVGSKVNYLLQHYFMFDRKVFVYMMANVLWYSLASLTYFKYVDDLTLVESRTGNQLSNMQHALNDFHDWSLQNNMSLNPTKCLVMSVSFSKNPPVPIPLSIGDKILNSVDKAKILGITVQSNLKWDSHVSDLLKPFTPNIKGEIQ